jgi:ribosomal-protein-alanine N-acetyltransferase
MQNSLPSPLLVRKLRHHSLLNPDRAISIQAATLRDIPEILGLEQPVATAAHWSQHQYEQSIQSTGEASGRLVLVARQAIKVHTGILGFLVARHIASEWELENIVVASTHQRQGIGRRLLEAMLQNARETKSATVFLEVRVSNTAARKLYESAGFTETGRRKSYYSGPSEDAILYRLDLN